MAESENAAAAQNDEPCDEGARPLLLRVKRRRGDAATEEIILATAQARADPKRMRMDEILMQQFGCMGVSGSSSTAAAQAEPEPQRRTRFRKVRTVDLTAFQGKTPQQVNEMLRAWSLVGHAAGPSPREEGDGEGATPRSTSGGSARAGAKAAKPGGSRTPVMRDLARQLSMSARYTQVRSKRLSRGMSAEAAESESALGDAFALYDIVCTDVDEGRSGERDARRRAAKEAAAKAAAEGAILMNYMPMISEYLAATGAAALPPAAGPSGAGDGSAGDDEFVYDVYVPVEGGGEEGGDVPVVEVEDVDDLFWQDPEGEDHDSEDSNAESYYANSYPDDEDGDSSDDDGGGEDWCCPAPAGVPSGRRQPGQSGGGRDGERWDDE
ncbi:hypothetical protein FOA52_005608, partial [Chlamydomonas sp. UWO 241]